MLSIDLHPDDPDYDRNWQPAPYGLRIDDYTILDLIEHAETVFAQEHDAMENGASIWDMEGSRNPADCAIVDLTSAFWDHELWIVVYRVHRCDGGPEEGGWTYDGYEVESKHRVDADSWAELVTQARTAREIYQDYYRSQEYGQPWSVLGDYAQYRVEIELVEQGWTNQNGPGKLERQPRPLYC